MSEEYLRQLRQLELQEKNLQDRYSTEEKVADVNDYKRIVNSQLKISPETGEKLTHYIERIKIYQELSHEKNWATHVDNPYKVWHTHKRPDCFMCEDQKFIRVLISVLQVISSSTRKFTF